MASAVDRFREEASRLGLSLKILEFPEGTRTAAEAAQAVDCDIGQIVKSLVFMADGRPVLVLASGKNRVDQVKLASAARAGSIERANADIVRATTGFAIGGVPPVGHATAMATFIDEDLLGYDIVFAAAGTPTAIFPITPEDLVRATGGTAADLAQPQ